jgi:hypothetical protein
MQRERPNRVAQRRIIAGVVFRLDLGVQIGNVGRVVFGMR